MGPDLGTKTILTKLFFSMPLMEFSGGTLSPTVRADRAALRDYFVTAFKVLPGLKVTFGEQLIRVYGSTAVNTGYYTFSYVKDGEPKTAASAL